MLKNAHFLAKIGADTAENEQHFAKILPIGRRGPSDLRRTARAQAALPALLGGRAGGCAPVRPPVPRGREVLPPDAHAAKTSAETADLPSTRKALENRRIPET